MLNGLPNTKVKLIIERQNKELEIVVTRKKIEVNAVPFYTIIGDDIGYISFVKFNEKASSEVKNAYLEL